MIEYLLGFLSCEILFDLIFYFIKKKTLESRKIMIERRLRILDKLCIKDKVIYMKEFLDWEIQEIKDKLKC